jgi:hypothetical protein|tara:strand:- start:1205 stop:1534 length:330 start_codon:yes stop_codon:yes gene_type:complete
MIELLLLIHFCMKIGRKLKQKGYSPLKYYFLIPIVWFSVQFVVGSIVTIAYMMINQDQGEPSLILVYIPALACAFGAAVLLSKKVDRLPEATEVDEVTGTIWLSDDENE